MVAMRRAREPPIKKSKGEYTNREFVKMNNIDIVKKSNQIKRSACEGCKEMLKGVYQMNRYRYLRAHFIEQVKVIFSEKRRTKK